ncbi:P-loop containing nucleoside triphosphate hydrolase protein [Podospora conica]|nr:P-loop containing nucleoside triphosphate hydrolase protein [Schizothecium conicum]
MRGLSASRMRWLLLSDLHFKHHDLDRVRQTAQWIVAEAERQQVGRVVVCGDLLTSRSMQPTHVLSACYRFISLLSDVVPRVHIVLGNHDLAYRRDYQTTALDALNIRRLAPYVSLHSAVSQDEWDGRRVLLLPFREEQDELVEAVAALRPNEASKTVAFAHLAINKAITQRYVVGADVDNPRAAKPITYHGFTGPDRFASLARTFTGHFHSHQTIAQEQSSSIDKIKGSVTYLGSPLQLSWADLYDEQRGVVLFDPETLEHELLINPHAVGYTTVDLQQVLSGPVDEGAVTDKHVMLVGKLTHLKYVTARDKLLSLGVRSVRNWSPMGFALHAGRASFGGLGASVPASDAAIQPSEEPAGDETGPASTTDAVLASDPGAEPRAEGLNLAAEAREYVESLDLDESLLSRREELVRVGQRMIQVSREVADQEDEVSVNHQDFLDRSSQVVGTRTATELAGPSTHVFVAEPRTLTITNFLGVQNTVTIDFQQDLPRGLTLLIGDNGSGKSTLIEAAVWCQFGRCVRGGMAVDDVVNDNVRKDCSVKLEFANGYTITRYRKHKTYKNRVIISLHGEPQPQLETQAAIDELLGTDYETYVRTVVLSHESAASFLNLTAAQRRDLIETSLGLSMLNQCGQVSRLLLKDIDTDVNKVEGKLEGLIGSIRSDERRFQDLDQTRKQFEDEAEEAVASLGAATRDHASKEAQAVELSTGFRFEISKLENQFYAERGNLRRLNSAITQMQEEKHARMQEEKLARIQEQKDAEPTSRLGRLQQQLSQRLEAMTAAHPIGPPKLFRAMETSILRFLLMTVSSLLRTFGTPKDGSPREGSPEDGSPEDGSPKDGSPEDASPKDASPKDASPKDGYPGTASAQDQNHDREAAVDGFRRDVEESASRLQSLEHEVEVSINNAILIIDQLAQAMLAHRACETLQQQVTIKQRDAAIYKRLAEAEQSSLHSLRSEHDVHATKLRELAADRELFVFWSSALAKRTRRASSSASSSSTAKAATSFREHMLVKSLSQLNALLVQVLAALYDDTRHAHMATGMLRSLFDSESADIMIDTPVSGSVLDPSLAVHSSLAYSKRSSGERKRIDLALFFALLQLARARSAHRAHYVLVDEVFDNLDKAGQAAVARWCSVMSPTVVGWILVITHSQFLVERDLGDYASKALVVRVRMGQGGTELFVDGSKLGGESGDEE